MKTILVVAALLILGSFVYWFCNNGGIQKITGKAKAEPINPYGPKHFPGSVNALPGQAPYMQNGHLMINGYPQN